MGTLVKINLNYCQYVRPESKKINIYRENFTFNDSRQIVKKCIDESNEWAYFVREFMDVKNNNYGNCFCHAVTLCSLLRAIGYSKDSCFVMITCHFSEDYGNATHATVLLRVGEMWHIYDTTKDNVDDGIFILENLKFFTESNRVLCIFNDIYGYLVNGDGIISDIDFGV